MSKERTLTFDKIPVSKADLEQYDLSDEYVAASLIVFALAEYENNPVLCPDPDLFAVFEKGKKNHFSNF